MITDEKLTIANQITLEYKEIRLVIINCFKTAPKEMTRVLFEVAVIRLLILDRQEMYKHEES
jgi:hypothetical protein